ncbi:MAG: hypothetical protein A3J83_08825 [Elusimicrobia bacterium RIFOXYA2_FULL_40_6]|nr:MAG: hypothetical protein A3J83_08825 [Elusimicrobia bacterium RIFOXYA2_FULL_40_6]
MLSLYYTLPLLLIYITMNYESGDYLTGAVYSTATAISMVGNNFQYEFSAWDIWNSSASAFLFGSGPAITNHSPVLSWAGVAGFTTDGVNPDSAIAGTSFTFKVKYSDVDNDAPALGCPQLIVTKGYNTLKCLAMNYESGDNLTGAIYSTTTIIQTAGNNINYQFSAYDIAGSSANMFISGQGPTITNHEPVLSWVGGVDYYNDGVSPNTARAGTPFTFKIKYTDADNNAPMSNYPRLLIEKGSNYLKNITLNFESGDYLNGAIYSTTTVMIAAGSDIHYQFSAYDICGDSASFVSASGPVIDNYKPVLSWAGGTGFTTDGVNPDTARAGTPFTFKVKYTDADNDAPATYYPRVSIKKGSSYVHNTILNYESGDFINGAIYSTTTVIVAAGSDIKYEFSAYDIWNDSASLIANGPQIDNNKPVLSWTGEPGYTADAVQPDSGGAQTPYIFRVKYTDADNDPPEWGRINLSISKNGSFIYSSGLNYQSGDFLNGAIYSATTYINNAGGEMDYELIAYDYWGTSASISNIGPIINNTNPKLEWTGEQNYSSCGVFPVTGVVTTTFTFRVKYIDADNDAPNSWCPRIHIKKAGVDIYWGQMTTTDTNNYSQGRIYSYSKMLSTGTDYTYYFEGPDCWYNLATGTPTAPMQGPYVILGDNTPPSTVGFVYDGLNNSDIDSANSVTQLCACWGCSGDAESMITKYWYAIGTSAGGTEILGWTDNGMNLTVTVTDLNLTVGQKYFFSVRAENGIGLLGDPVSSNGQTVVLPGTYLDLSESKTYPNPSILNTAGNIAKSVMKFSHLPNGTDLGIYSISGKLVCKLNESASGGAGEIQWDGKNGNGDYIAQGIYLYILKTPDGQKKTGKIAVKRN